MKNIVLLLFVAALTMSCGSNKDKNRVSQDFKIKFVSLKDAIVKLECTEGCAWKELSWSKNNNRPQAINAYGMISQDEPINTKDKLPDFKILIEPTDNGATLESLNGTAWKKLSFSCINLSDCSQIVDFNGVTQLK